MATNQTADPLAIFWAILGAGGGLRLIYDYFDRRRSAKEKKDEVVITAKVTGEEERITALSQGILGQFKEMHANFERKLEAVNNKWEKKFDDREKINREETDKRDRQNKEESDKALGAMKSEYQKAIASLTERFDLREEANLGQITMMGQEVKMLLEKIGQSEARYEKEIGNLRLVISEKDMAMAKRDIEHKQSILSIMQDYQDRLEAMMTDIRQKVLQVRDEKEGSN